MNKATKVLLQTLFLATSAVGVYAQKAGTKGSVAEWTTFRANNNRDARVVARGNFTNHATLRSSIDFSTSDAYVELLPARGDTSIFFMPGQTDDPGRLNSLDVTWPAAGLAYLDLNGDGNMEAVNVSQHVKYARLFKDEKYYRITAHDGFGFGNSDTTSVRLQVHEGNSDRLLFDRKFKKNVNMQRPHITVADMDNDGEQDIVITSWEGVYVFNNRGDSIAGLSERVDGWHHLRKRGFAAIADVDGNGYKDVVIIGAYPYHVDVIKNEGGVLRFGWTRIFDAYIESAKMISKPILNSVSDFDGDGTTEILVNVFNFSDEGNWSALLFDASTGAIKGQLKNAFVLSATDLNNDGKYVFFCTETRSQAVPEVGTQKAMSFGNDGFRELLRIDKGRWITQRIVNVSPTVTTHTDGISSLGEDAVLCAGYGNSGRQVFFATVKNPDGSSSITGYQMSAAGKVNKTALAVSVPEGMEGEMVKGWAKAGGGDRLLLRLRSFQASGGSVTIRAATARVLGRFTTRNRKDHIPVVADINADGRIEILIPNEVGDVVCFSPDRDGGMEVRWKIPGHGMLFQYRPLIDYGIAVDDLDHDGRKEIIVSGGDEQGAVLSVFDSEGVLLWTRSFPEINARDVTFYDGNIVFFGTAQSSGRNHRDVIVTVQRVIQHTGKTYCLNGIDGSVVWKLDRLTVDRDPGDLPLTSGAGGNVFSVYDIDGDGSDEVMSGYGNILMYADSDDGSIQFKAFMRRIFTDQHNYPAEGYPSFWVDQMLPVALVNADKIRLSSFNSLPPGTLDTEGNLLWFTEDLPYSDRLWQCMANIDGDGKLWVVELSTRVSDNRQVLFAYDPLNGKHHKTFSIEINGTMPVACDMDGDGRDEIVVSNDTGIYCIANRNGRTEIAWQYLEKDCGPVVVADTDADGLVEVVTATRDGRILIFDN